MANDSEILFPAREVRVGNGTVKVNELAWPDARAFLRELGGYIGRFTNEQGEVRIDVGLITELIGATESLSTMIIAKTTGMSEEQMNALKLSKAMEIIEQAVDLNTLIIVERGKKMAGGLTRFADARRAAEPKTTTPTITPAPPTPS